MKSIKLILIILMGLTIMAFKSKDISPPSNVKTGEYGVCDCDSSAFNTAKTKLTIHEDRTFNYFDNSDRKKPINIKGNWTVIGKKISLKYNQSDGVINDKWTIDKKGKCLKSQKGLQFTRLCHLKSCN